MLKDVEVTNLKGESTKTKVICDNLIFVIFCNVIQGPDFVWHLDGYDKLKPYGFAIHGYIDG